MKEKKKMKWDPKTILTMLKFLPLAIFVFLSAICIHVNNFFQLGICPMNWSCKMFNLFALTFKRIHYSGDEVDTKDRAIIVSNHFSDSDFVYFIKFMADKAPHLLPQFISKREVSNIFPLGFGIRTLGGATVSRNDPAYDMKQIKKMTRRRDGWPVLFPEGRVLRQENLEWSEIKRDELGLPQAHNVLLPQPKGLASLIQTGEYDTIYDVTISYEGYKGGVHDLEDERTPTAIHLVENKDAGKVHIDIRRLELTKKDATLQEVTDFLNNRWLIKDKRLDYFVEHQEFPSFDFDIEN